jgi:hypothetical protein
MPPQATQCYVAFELVPSTQRLQPGRSETSVPYPKFPFLCQFYRVPCVHLQLMGMQETEKVLIGMHFRRLLQWFLAPVPSSE